MIAVSDIFTIKPERMPRIPNPRLPVETPPVDPTGRPIFAGDSTAYKV